MVRSGWCSNKQHQQSQTIEPESNGEVIWYGVLLSFSLLMITTVLL